MPRRTSRKRTSRKRTSLKSRRYSSHSRHYRGKSSLLNAQKHLRPGSPLFTYKLVQNTKLYRVNNTDTGIESLEPQVCGDTWKKGLYFATSPIIPLGMLVERFGDVPTTRELGEFTLTDDVDLVYGKYSGRSMSVSLSHIDCDALPLEKGTLNKHFTQYPDEVDWGCEVFLNKKDLTKIQLVRTSEWTPHDAETHVKEYSDRNLRQRSSEHSRM